MKVLIACEESQTVCKEFRALGHEAYSCDIQDCSGGHPEWHLKGDVFSWLMEGWDLVIAHPPCTYLSKAGARWLHKGNGVVDVDRYMKGLKAVDFFKSLLDAPCPKVVVENPTPLKIWELPPCNQVIQPYEYGDAFSKRTLLWLKGVPPLVPTNILSNFVPYMPSNTGGAKRGQKHTKGFVKTQREASKTFIGIARAMAQQWGGDARHTGGKGVGV